MRGTYTVWQVVLIAAILLVLAWRVFANNAEVSAPPPDVAVTLPVLAPAPKHHSIAEQQAYNCQRVCRAGSMEVAHFTPGAPGKAACVCGNRAHVAAQHESPGVGTGVEVGLGMEVGRRVGGAVLDELLR